MTEQVAGPADQAAAGVLERIHVLMWRNHVKQTKLAPMVGVDQSVLSKKLRGKVPLTLVELLRIADALGVSAAELMGAQPADLLPRLDSNQEPSGYRSSQVRRRHLVAVG